MSKSDTETSGTAAASQVKAVPVPVQTNELLGGQKPPETSAENETVIGGFGNEPVTVTSRLTVPRLVEVKRDAEDGFARVEFNASEVTIPGAAKDS